jgi:heptosyltransferase-1
MGDVLHNLPVVSDLARMYPDMEIDWVTEAPYVGLVALHPGVRRVISTRLRDLKKRWWSTAEWSSFLEARTQLRNQSYDIILDTQGLIKSALVSRWANGPIAGYSRDTAREPLAAAAYDRCVVVPRDLHAVERNRRLAAGIFGYEVPVAVDYGLRLPAPPVSATGIAPPPAAPYVAFLHATSRADKMWPASHWTALGQRLHDHGLHVLLPWGSAAERHASVQLAQAIPGAIVPPPMSLVEAAALLAAAHGVIGVDTGLAHLSVALGRPTVGLYLTTSPALTGLYGNNLAVNLGGGTTQHPAETSVDEAWHALNSVLSPH